MTKLILVLSLALLFALLAWMIYALTNIFNPLPYCLTCH